jgi:polyisoprenoid-binding protein YceI
MAQWIFDPAHTVISFAARHMMIMNVRGIFEKASGTLNFDPANPAATTVEASVETASIYSNMAQRDGHLKSPDFFDVENHPLMTFKSTKVEPTSESTAKLTGDLTIRGVTRAVTFNVDYLGTLPGMDGKPRAGFQAQAKINREDYGLNWNVALEAGGWLVGKEITINIDAEMIQTEPATA